MRRVMICCIILIALFIVLASRNYITRYNSFETKYGSGIVDEDRYFKIINQGDANYHYIIYNKDKKIVKEENHYGTPPLISYIDEKTIEILLSAGTDIFFCTYYDIYNDKFSEQYESPIITQYNKIVYLDHNKNPFTLVVSNIYDKKNFLKEFELEDISFVVSPITKAEFLDEYTLRIAYISGERYEERTVILNLND